MTFKSWFHRVVGGLKLYPRALWKRLVFWLGPVLLFVGALNLQKYGVDWYTWTTVASVPIWLVTLYLLQDEPQTQPIDAYQDVIGKVDRISDQLSEIAGFLKQELVRIKESEATLVNLQEEKTKLEPVVKAQRDTVNAILAAHANATSRSAWKERVLGFMSGILASLIASAIYGLLRR